MRFEGNGGVFLILICVSTAGDTQLRTWRIGPDPVLGLRPARCGTAGTSDGRAAAAATASDGRQTVKKEKWNAIFVSELAPFCCPVALILSGVSFFFYSPCAELIGCGRRSCQMSNGDEELHSFFGIIEVKFWLEFIFSDEQCNGTGRTAVYPFGFFSRS